MDFTLSEEQIAFRDSIRRFALAELGDDAARRASHPEYPWDVARKLAGLGVLGITFPEADGGAGGTLVDAILAIQAVGEVCPRSADIVQAGNFGPIRTFVQSATA